MPSQAAAAAVTEEVSFTAVPAKSAKPSLESPSTLPSVGNTSAAITLNRKMTEMACATSSSRALMTGAVAAMAEPPQMEEPTPTSVAMRSGMWSALQSTNATMSAVAMVETITGSDWAPTRTTSAKFKPNPSRMTAYCRIFFEVKVMPWLVRSRRFHTSAMAMPAKMPKTGPPISGNA